MTMKHTFTKEIQTNFRQNMNSKFLNSQKTVHPLEKQSKFRPQRNEKHFQLDKKLFRQPEKIELLNYLKTP